MNLELTGKTAVVTGGAKGIGEAISRTLAAEGATVIILGRNPAEAKTLIAEITDSGGNADTIHAELTDDDAIAKAVYEITQRHETIDIIINNAGCNDAINLRHTSAEFRKSLNRNLVHSFTLVHHALDHLISSQGTIINIGSKTATTGQGGTSGYAAANGALHALTREWAVDLARFGIRVNCVVPAEVITPQYERWLFESPDPNHARQLLNQSVPLGNRTTTVQEIADTVAFIASPRSSHTTGQILYVDGGYVHLDRSYTMQTAHLKKTQNAV